jgi:diguanylate cyclase (GGDEF)-like protein
MNTSQEPIRILVADDDESLRSVLKQVLNIDGYEVTLAASGEEALAAFKKEPCPLIITDIRMGKMSGMELLHEVKRLRPETEIIIMTSHAALDTAITAVQAGAYDYLAKPFEDISLISSVARRAIDKIRLTAENNALLEKLRQKNVELEKSNEMLKNLAIRDGLTGLYNHRHFQEALTTELLRSRRYSRSVSLIFLDVDFFKKYNDTHGHPEGDKILVALARIFQDCLRMSDSVARYGGEEFVFLLPETAKEGALHVAESIRKKVFDHPFPGRETQPLGRVTISLGVATFPQDGTDGSSIIERADKALYDAKKTGRNRVC